MPGTRSQLWGLWAHVPGRGLCIRVSRTRVILGFRGTREDSAPEKPPFLAHRMAYDPPSQPSLRGLRVPTASMCPWEGLQVQALLPAHQPHEGHRKRTGQRLGWGPGARQRSRQHRSRGGRRAPAEGGPAQASGP